LKYYLETLLSSHTTAKETKPMETTFDLPIDLNDPNPICENHNYGNGTQVPLSLANLLSLPHLHHKLPKAKFECDYNEPLN
jgi:hypothetical protein